MKLYQQHFKTIATSFFYWWYNAPGKNTSEGYDAWAENSEQGKELIQEVLEDINQYHIDRLNFERKLFFLGGILIGVLGYAIIQLLTN